MENIAFSAIIEAVMILREIYYLSTAIYGESDFKAIGLIVSKIAKGSPRGSSRSRFPLPFPFPRILLTLAIQLGSCQQLQQ